MDVPHHLRRLNPGQQAAALATEGPVLVLAGAGSGKTRTLVHRVAHLLHRGVEPRRILAVTFTNRAAAEMRERIAAEVGKAMRALTVSTFHSLGARILRDHHTRVGLPEKFAIYATGDQLGLIRRIMGEEVHVAATAGDDVYDAKRVLSRISGWKNRMMDPAAAAAELAGGAQRGNRTDDYEVLSAGVYPRYESALRAAGACDFDDLLLLPVRLLRDDIGVREAMWKRWHYLMVDEYQDTNSAQFEMARLMAGPHRNLCVVGDDDQSIYAWRGADLRNILDFERHFPGARVVILEENYRSTQRILDAANAVIAHNLSRKPKTMRTGNGPGPRIDYWEMGEDEGRSAEEREAAMVASEIGIRRFREQLKWGDFAVLYRTNLQSKVLEEAMRNANIPYRVVGGTSYFDRKEIADAAAYLRVVVQPRDEIALRRIINYPTRGIGRATVLRLVEAAREAGLPLGDMIDRDEAAPVRRFAEMMAAARRALAAAEALAASGSAQGAGADTAREAHAGRGSAQGTGADPATESRALRGSAEGARTDSSAGWPAAQPLAGAASIPESDPHPSFGQPLQEWAQTFFRDIGLEAAIRAEHGERSADARIDNLRDFIAAIGAYERRTWAAMPLPDEEIDWVPPSLEGFLHKVSLVDDEEDAEEEDDGARVTLMTLHSAKGLEFAHVFLVGLEEEILPHARSVHDLDAGIEEERRLFYVGITRARHRLTLSWCRTRKQAERQPSRFLKEIPSELLEVQSAAAPSSLSEGDRQELKANFFATMKELLG